MAQIILNIDDTVLPLMVNALAWRGNYTPASTNAQGTVLTKNQFAKQQLINYIFSTVGEYQNQQAMASVVQPANTLIS